MIYPKAQTAEAYRLLHDGARALAIVEHRGIRVDEAYLAKTIDEVSAAIIAFEDKLKSTDVWKTWCKTYPNPNLDSLDQMAMVLFDKMGVEAPVKRTEKTKKYKMDEEAISHIDHPFCRLYLQKKKYNKIKSTYLHGIEREVVSGVLHPSYNLHLARTYRSSSSDPNFQNFPIRNKMMGKLIRSCFIPRKGRRLVEVDYSGIEVRIAYCYHKDKVMRKYLLDPNSDMHRDVAKDLFFIPDNVDPATYKKTLRDSSKNQMVFPQFYGSVWFQCAPAIWDRLQRNEDNDDYKVGKLHVLEHLKRKGITELGECDPDFVRQNRGAEDGTFSAHVQACEQAMWKRFSQYAKWKKDWHKAYLETGSFSGFTGFTWEGILKRNDVINYPVQSAAFHCLLKSLIEIQRVFTKKKFRSCIVGQIHDSLILDVTEEEFERVLQIVKRVMTQWVPEQWKWITIPLEIEAEAAPVDRPWFEKEKVKI